VTDFSDPGERARWLEAHSQEAAVALAARAVLRAVPNLKDRSDVLPVFRSAIVSWAWVAYPSNRQELGRPALAVASEARNVNRYFLERAASAAAASAIVPNWPVYTSDAILHALEAASSGFRKIDDRALRALAIDADKLNEGLSPDSLVRQRLWLDRQPTWARNNWEQLKQALLTEGKDWDVWIDWYEDRLHGRVTNQALELARVNVPYEIWMDGPIAANSYIKKLIEQHLDNRPPDPRNQAAFKHWLLSKPSSWSLAIAVRALLRVIPSTVISPQGSSDAVLPIARAAAISMFVLTHGEGQAEAAAAAEFAASASFRPELILSALLSTACDVARAAAAASDPASISFSWDAISGAYGVANATASSEETFATAIYRDAEALHGGSLTPQGLALAKLWPMDLPPAWAQQLWRDFDALLHRDHWSVWTKLYDEAVKGLSRSKAWIASFTDVPGLLPWDDGPEAVNAEIARRLEQLAPRPEEPPDTSVPPQRPAAIEPFWENGVLTLPKAAATTDLEDQQFAAALRGLSAEIRGLAEDIGDEANIDRRFVSHLRKLADRIPQELPTQDELFRLGHIEAVFEGYSKTVKEQWPDFLAVQYHALTLHFDRTMRQSGSWRAFKRNAARESLSAQQIADAIPLAKETAIALRQEDAREFVDPILPQIIESLADSLTMAATVGTDDVPKDIIEGGQELLAIDLIESVNNTLKPIAEAALSTAADVGTEYAKGVKKGLVRAAKREGPKDGEKLFKWLRRGAIGGGAAAVGWSVGLAPLIQKCPEAFGWLLRLLHL
jgi:hypothetical protein